MNVAPASLLYLVAHCFLLSGLSDLFYNIFVSRARNVVSWMGPIKLLLTFASGKHALRRLSHYNFLHTNLASMLWSCRRLSQYNILRTKSIVRLRFFLSTDIYFIKLLVSVTSMSTANLRYFILTHLVCADASDAP